MPAKRRPMRYAHCEGHTDLCYSDDGKYILTCGHDGDVRLWFGLEDDDPISHCVGEKAFAVCHKGTRLFVSTDSNHVQAYTFPEMERDGILSRFTAPVTHITTNNSSKVIASGSCDMNISVTEPDSSRSFQLSGHTAPVLGLTLDPKAKYLASSSCDGTVRVWSLEDRKTVKMWNCLPTSNSFFLATCFGRPSWQPISGQHLALPDKNEVHVYARDSWENTISFSGEQSKAPFSITAFSTCDRFLAASTTNGDIFIWNVTQKTCISYTEHDQHRLVCSLAWNPSGKGEIAYCDMSGQLGTIEDIITAEEVVAKQDAVPKPAESHMDSDDDKLYDNLLDDDEDDGENVISLSKIKESLTQPGNLDLDLEEKSTKDEADDDDDDAASKVSGGVRSAPMASMQPPFQPTSTPVHLQHRFMVWNSVGIVRAFNTEEENSLDVEFHDSALHHALHMTNFLKHTMASLSEEALLLACEAGEDTPSKVVCVLLNAWDGSREWTVDLPEDEEAMAIATSDKWLAVATDTRNLRFFTLGGTQREVISLPGPVVCLAPQKNKLLAVYHSGGGLSFVLLHIKSNVLQAVSPFQPLAVSPQSTLMWLGFSDEGTPCTMDSAGVVRMFSSGGYWLPVCSTKNQCKGKSDHFFVLGVSERYQNIRCVLCKGSHYPPTTPRPAVTEIPLQFPLCDALAEKSVLEETFWKTKTISSTLDVVRKMDSSYEADKKAVEKLMKETIIKLFALACRSGLEHRAVDLCELMPSHQVVELAVKYASKLGKMHLANRLSEVVARKKKESEMNSQEEYMNSRYSFPSTSLHSVESEVVLSAHHRRSTVIEDPDPFADSQEVSSSPATPASQEKENILIAAKQRMSILSENRPSQKKINPFKKSVDSSDGHKGLDRLIASYVQGNKESQQDTPTPPPAAKKKQMSLKGKSPGSTTPSSKPSMTFVQWFAVEKAALQEEFPNMSATEITRLGMKRFKEFNQREKQNTPAKENHTPNKEDMNSQDMKSIEETACENHNSQQKNEDKTARSPKKSEENEKNAPALGLKRKPEDEAQHQVTKKSTSQKLSCFAFKK